MRPLFPAALPLSFMLVVAACSSTPPTRFHTLLPAEPAIGTVSVQASNPAWLLLPVTVPTAVGQPQMVVRLADDTLAALEQDRWIAPLADELGTAVSSRLVRANLSADAAAPWRIEVAVQRFESIVGRSARIDAEWTLARAGSPALRCRGSFEQSVGAGIPALAAGHRATAAALGDAVAASLRSVLGGAPAC